MFIFLNDSLHQKHQPFSEIPEEHSVSNSATSDSVSNSSTPTAALSADHMSTNYTANVINQIQPILYTIYETGADFEEEDASVRDIMESIEKDSASEFASKLENTKTKAELVSELNLKTKLDKNCR